MSGAQSRVDNHTKYLIDVTHRGHQRSPSMDPFSTNYYHSNSALDSGTMTGTGNGSSNSNRSGTTFADFNISPAQSYYNTHRSSDPGYVTRSILPAEDTMDLSRFDLLARSAVSNMHLQDVIKPANNTPWVGPQQHRVHRASSSRPSLHRSPYAKSEPLLRQEVYSDAADSGYVSQWPGTYSTTAQYSMNMHELEQDYQPLLEMVSPTGGADNHSTVSDSRMMSGAKQRKGKRPLTQCVQCGRQPRNLSDSKKHALTHTKPYRCTEHDCTRKDGFATENDLQRHRKSVHNLLPTVGSPAGYICAACVPEVDAPPKFWPRRDNFKAHIKRKHPHHHEATLIEASRRRLRPGDDRVLQRDAEPVRDGIRSAQRSQVDTNEFMYERPRLSVTRSESSVHPELNGIFGPDSGIAMPNESALVGMQGHAADQFGNVSAVSSSYGDRNMDGYISGTTQDDSYGTQPNRLLTVLSEAAENMDYSTSPLFVSGPKRPSKIPPEYGQSDVRYKASSSYPCQHPDCNKVLVNEYDFSYGQRLPSAS